MRFLIVIHEADPEAWLSATPEQVEETYAAHRAFDAAVEARGTLHEGAALSSASDGRILRSVDGRRVVTDGPYAETVEQMTGVYVVDLPDLDTAVELSRLLPSGYDLEIRPTMSLDDY